MKQKTYKSIRFICISFTCIFYVFGALYGYLTSYVFTVYSLHYVKLTSVAYLKADSAMLSISSSSFIMSLAQW